MSSSKAKSNQILGNQRRGVSVQTPVVRRFLDELRHQKVDYDSQRLQNAIAPVIPFLGNLLHQVTSLNQLNNAASTGGQITPKLDETIENVLTLFVQCDLTSESMVCDGNHDTAPTTPWIRRRGEYWEIGFEGEHAHVRHREGLDMLVKLLESPYRSFEIWDFIPCDDERALAKANTSRQEIEKETVKQLRKEIDSLKEETQRQKQQGVQVSKDLQERLRQCSDALRCIKKVGNKKYIRFDIESIKLYDRLRRNLDNALKCINRSMPQLASHLQQSIWPLWVNNMSYQPPQGFPDWEIG